MAFDNPNPNLTPTPTLALILALTPTPSPSFHPHPNQVAVALDVLQPKHLKGKRAAVDPAKKPAGFEAFSNKHIRPMLTFDGPDYQPVRETGVRFEAAVETLDKHAPASKFNFKAAVQMAVMRSKDIKSSLSEPALEAALKGSGLAVRESLFEDTIDEMRVQLPMYSTDQLRKILEENDGKPSPSPQS